METEEKTPEKVRPSRRAEELALRKRKQLLRGARNNKKWQNFCQRMAKGKRKGILLEYPEFQETEPGSHIMDNAYCAYKKCTNEEILYEVPVGTSCSQCGKPLSWAGFNPDFGKELREPPDYKKGSGKICDKLWRSPFGKWKK